MSSTTEEKIGPRIRWVPAPVPESAAELVAAGYPEWLAFLLARRGVSDATSAEAFLSPSLDQLHPATLLDGMDEALDRLASARRADHAVAIVGDYDVDGVTGTALLTAVLGSFGIETVPILPHRIRDGYGFQPSHVEKAIAAGCRLVVTVDCGTTSHRAIEAARAAGLGVIVTDHHLPGEPLGEDVVLVNPRQPESRYPFADLSGAGLAFKLALALAEREGRAIDPARLARIACLGTIADMVPLLGENRVIASVGLKGLETTRSVGLKALMDVSRIRPPFSSDDVGFRLGPRINAAGRLDSADPALELLLTRDSRRAKKLAADLDAKNRERQQWERQAAEGAREHFLAQDRLPTFPVAWDPAWHRGVVGIAAGKLAREFHRPVLLLADEGDTATGSGRSIPGIHLHDFLAPWRERLQRFGGHAQAIGLTAAVPELAELQEEWSHAAQEAWAEALATRQYEYEISLPAAQVGKDTLREMQRLAPFGQGNARPLIRVVGPLQLVRPPRKFGRDHLEAELTGEDRGRITVLGWGWGPRAADLEGEVEVLGYLELDRYRGAPVLRLKDCRPASAA